MAAISSAPTPPPPPQCPGDLRRRNHSISPLCLSLRRRPLSISSRLYSSRRPSASSTNASSNGSNDGGQPQELHHLPPPPAPISGREGAQVYVTLPADSARPGGQVARRKALGASLLALAAAGVEGVAIEFWWGVVEKDLPGVYDWSAYVELVDLAAKNGLKVRAIMAFHQHRSTDPGDACV